MAGSGVCCDSLEEPKALMKMGLSVLLVGHVNFLLAALVHGVVLRHINLHKQARAMEYAISNVIALVSGLLGVVVGILAIILSKNKRRRALLWALFALSLAAALTAAAAAIGLLVSVVRAIVYGGRSLLTHCRFPDAIGYSSVTNECPFDPTRIYSTTLILWVPLIVTCVVQLVFSARCFAACVSFLDLPCCPARSRASHYGRPIDVVSHMEEARPLRRARPPRGQDEAPPRHGGHRRSHHQPPRHHRPTPAPPPPQHRSRAPPERQPPRQPHGERSSRERQETRPGNQQRPPEQHRPLQRGALQRSSFWI